MAHQDCRDQPFKGLDQMMLTKSARLRALLKRYAKDTDGNFSIIFVAGLSASLIIMGAVFDVSLMIKSQNRLQNLTDGAALMALRYEGDIISTHSLISIFMRDEFRKRPLALIL